jgi:MFS family permease
MSHSDAPEIQPPETVTARDPAVTYCTYHPTIPTTLRCNRCEKPICPKDAIKTPTGYRCRDCVRGLQKVFETALWYDYIVGAGTAGFLAFLGSLIVPRIGFFGLFIAPLVGGLIAEAVRWLTRRRRAPRLFLTITAAALVGSLINPLLYLLILFQAGSLGGLLSLIWYGVYSFIVTSTIYYRLGGIQIR